jgi:arylsulfatase A-like enzyme
MKRRELLETGLAAFATPFIGAPKKAARRTNVVMFMTDDHGAWATGAYGCAEMHTPNIDRLAAGGAQFMRAYSCTPVCSPSRMTFMTGSLPSIHGVQDWLLPEDSYFGGSRRWLEGHLTYTEVLKRNGYTLGMFGKWHMGHDDEAQVGFTQWATVPGGGGPYVDQEFVHNGERKKMAGFKTDVATDFALEFLQQQKDASDPFYLLVPFYAPHTPYDYQPEVDREWFKDSSFPCFPNLPMNPNENPGLRNLVGKRESKWAYSALIAGVDRNVGRVLTKLDELGLRDDTLVIFTADQGWSAGHHGVWGKGNGTIPFNLYEEAIQVPLIWNQPGRIAAGMKPTPMVSSYDYFPTILDYLGVPAPAVDRRRVGRSYAPFLRGQKPAWINRLYFEYAHMRGMRTETLKYLERAEGWPAELYDLEADPRETHNLLEDAAYQGRRKALQSELHAYFEKAGAPPLEEWRTTTKQKLPSESATKGPSFK